MTLQIMLSKHFTDNYKMELFVKTFKKHLMKV